MKFKLLVCCVIGFIASSGYSSKETSKVKTKPWQQMKIDREQLKQELTPLQYEVTQHSGTEPAFQNIYWDHKEEGIYVDIVSGEPLFSSKDKFQSGTGWPSFSQPIVNEHITEKIDRRFFQRRIEVRSHYGNSHLGHVFSDGPPPTGKRYCINSAALRFVPRQNLAAQGYGEFEKLFHDSDKTSIATFAGGCFWCMEPPFEKLEGVIRVVSGYMGGQKEHPTYAQVSSGSTGHAEVVQITFDPKKISYEQLLSVFWRQIDPTIKDQQFVDVGSQYRTAIFTHDDSQKKMAQLSKADLEKKNVFGKPIVTEILPAGPFYEAETYHQDYYKKNPIRYKFYRSRSGRDQYLKSIWK